MDRFLDFGTTVGRVQAAALLTRDRTDGTELASQARYRHLYRSVTEYLNKLNHRQWLGHSHILTGHMYRSRRVENG